MSLTRAQHDVLMKPLMASRVATRSQGGKTLSYLESWDVRAHLIRLFGFTNFDVEVIEYRHVTDRPYPDRNDAAKEMVEVVYSARVRLTIRMLSDGTWGECTYVEGAVGSASGPMSMLGEHHDNALKTAASDALKRCAINLGTQFGLSLYKNGTTNDIVKNVLVTPAGESTVPPAEELTDEQKEALAKSLGAEVISEEPA